MSINHTIITSDLSSATQVDLNTYLKTWDQFYHSQVVSLDLLNPYKTSQWTPAQKERFVRAFYHIRGHFHEFLWHLGNFAPNAAMKELILGNFRDEFGEHGYSHEYLYRLFAQAVGVDLVEEHLEETIYLPFITEFNKGFEFIAAHQNQ